jgi:hypothetical protein
VITEEGLDFRAQRHHFHATGPDGWYYVIYFEWHRVWGADRPKREWYSIKEWEASAGGAIHYTVSLGRWRTFAQAQAACEVHAIRARVS